MVWPLYHEYLAFGIQLIWCAAFYTVYNKEVHHQTQRQSENLSHRHFSWDTQSWWSNAAEIPGGIRVMRGQEVTYQCLSKKLCFYTERNGLWPQFRQTQRLLVQYAEKTLMLLSAKWGWFGNKYCKRTHTRWEICTLTFKAHQQLHTLTGAHF